MPARSIRGILSPVIYMQNIPVFLSQGGTATLILKEIPHKHTAYVLLRTVLPKGLPVLLEECGRFCRGCGAQQVFVSPGDTGCVLSLPHAYDIYRLHIKKNMLPSPVHDLSLIPISPENDPIYQRIYNICFRDVSHALTYDRAQIQRIYRSGHRGFLALDSAEVPWGMGELHGNELAAVGLLPEFRGHGRGQALTLALLSRCPGPELTLTVVSDNDSALALYDHLGFTVSGTESQWYRL